MGSVAW